MSEPPVSEPIVRIEGLTRRFGTVAAVDGIDLDVARGELFALLGGSGCGKTTLLRMLAGLEIPDAGRILIDGRENVFLRPSGERTEERNALDPEAVTSQVQLLLSRELALDVIKKNKLAERPEFDPVLTTGIPGWVVGNVRQQTNKDMDVYQHPFQMLSIFGGLRNRGTVIEVLPANIPDSIEVDVTDLGVGDAIHVRDLAANAAWSPVTDADLMIVHVVTIKAVEETPAAGAEGAAAAAPAAGGAEPEVIKKGKTDEAKADDKKK